MKRILYMTVLTFMVFAAVSCEDRPATLEELGLPQTEYIVGKEAGILSVGFYANTDGRVTLLDEASWIRLESDVFSSDGKLRVSYEDNSGFPRMARLQFALDSNPGYVAVLTIKQEGYEQPYLSFPEQAVSLYNGGDGHLSVPMDTNVPKSDISVTTRILDGDATWVTGVDIIDGSVNMEVEDNTGADKRIAVVTFSYDNGWGETISSDLRLIQAGNGNSFGTPVTFGQVRQLATSDGTMIQEGILEAYVVSDRASGNVNDNTRLASKSIDYTVCERSAYIQSLDGSYGFLVVMNSEEDNAFATDTKVTLDLSEVTVRRYDNPERYVLENMTAYAILKASDASGQIAEKVKNITELTDADIYTRVTLADVEWPVRKGSLTPCYEFMTNACNNDSANKFATLLRGKDGGSMYILTNTTCPYRRDGSRMGYGSGTVRGIIVHEKHRPFSDYDAAVEADYGYIGDYQIRHMTKEDIRLADSFRDGFSEMLCEFRYAEPEQDYYLKATYGEGRMSHTGPYSSSYNGYGFNGLTYYDFSYLGPVGNGADYFFGNNRGDENGFGIIIDDTGEDYGNTAAYDIPANADGRGRTPRLNDGNLAWGAVKWWDYDTGRPYFWLVEFSTAGIVTDRLSMQLSMLNQCQNGLSPRFWKAEWSLSDDTADDSSWTQIGEVFSVPDVIPDSFDPASWMSSAFKPMDFPLPLEMLGHEKVYIRIGPSENKASDRTGYANATIAKDNYSGGTMNYFAIRYNK